MDKVGLAGVVAAASSFSRRLTVKDFIPVAVLPSDQLPLLLLLVGVNLTTFRSRSGCIQGFPVTTFWVPMKFGFDALLTSVILVP